MIVIFSSNYKSDTFTVFSGNTRKRSRGIFLGNLVQNAG
jgi:hypothetical protein